MDGKRAGLLILRGFSPALLVAIAFCDEEKFPDEVFERELLLAMSSMRTVEIQQSN
jgi:hypothetical protein